MKDKPNVVVNYKIGNTEVIIADNYCIMKENVQKKLDEIAQCAFKYF